MLIVLVFVLANTYQLSAQDTIQNFQDSLIYNATNTYSLNYKKLIVPAVFIGYGIVSLENDGLKQLNKSTRHEIWEHQPDHIRLDNYTQYAPALMVYGLNLAGVIQGQNDYLRNFTINYSCICRTIETYCQRRKT